MSSDTSRESKAHRLLLSNESVRLTERVRGLDTNSSSPIRINDSAGKITFEDYSRYLQRNRLSIENSSLVPGSVGTSTGDSASLEREEELLQLHRELLENEKVKLKKQSRSKNEATMKTKKITEYTRPPAMVNPVLSSRIRPSPGSGRPLLGSNFIVKSKKASIFDKEKTKKNPNENK
mmetsp:Transcript_15728/g.24164  ORF Transcript_15728/g.24164 Transcript_15728/m.24164 type:complete len:178 (-) Transcript_15728:1404-1937(-)